MKGDNGATIIMDDGDGESIRYTLDDIDLLAALLWLESKSVLRSGEESAIFSGLTVIEARKIRETGFDKLKEILNGRRK